MGYFSNGCEGDEYQAKYCERCIHWQDENPCAVWYAHIMTNYDDCNFPGSILHLLIPRTNDGLGNEQCTMFVSVAGKPHQWNHALNECECCKRQPATAGNHHAENCPRWTL